MRCRGLPETIQTKRGQFDEALKTLDRANPDKLQGSWKKNILKSIEEVNEARHHDSTSEVTGYKNIWEIKMKFLNLISILAVAIVFSTSVAVAQPNIILLLLVDDMGLMDTSVPMLADQDGKPKRHPLNDWYRT